MVRKPTTKCVLSLTIVFLWTLALMSISFVESSDPTDVRVGPAYVIKDLGQMPPPSFEPNLGQIQNDEVLFRGRGVVNDTWFTDTHAAVFPRFRSGGLRIWHIQSFGFPAALSDPAPRNPEGQDLLPGEMHYTNGRPEGWTTNVPLFRTIVYEDVYSGIDLHYRLAEDRLIGEFVIEPGATPNSIRLGFYDEYSSKFSFSAPDWKHNLRSRKVDESGNLVLSRITGAKVVLQKPFLYQEISGEQREIEGSYRHQGAFEVGINVGSYDASHPLFIEYVFDLSPLRLTVNQSIALGASSNPIFPNRLGVDRFDNVYVGLPGAIAKLGPNDHQLLYMTHVIGCCGDLSFDHIGNLHLQDHTYGFERFVSKLESTGDGIPLFLPATGGEQVPSRSTSAKGVSFRWSFVQGCSGATQTCSSVYGLNPDGSYYFNSPSLATLPGIARNIDIGPSGGIFVAGWVNGCGSLSTAQEGFPRCDTPEENKSPDAFVVKLDSLTGRISYATYIGGEGDDVAGSIFVDDSGNAYVMGTTDSSDFPTLNPSQAENRGMTDAFVVKLDPMGEVEYSTYLGGETEQTGLHIVADSKSNIYVSGITNGPIPIPARGPVDSTNEIIGLNSNFYVKLTVATDLSISTTAVDEAALERLEFDYELTIRNDGSADATNLIVSANNPVNVDVVAASIHQGSCKSSGSNVTCSLDELASGATATIALQIAAASSTGQPQIWSAHVTSDQADLDETNNSVEWRSTMAEPQELLASPTSVAPQVEPPSAGIPVDSTEPKPNVPAPTERPAPPELQETVPDARLTPVPPAVQPQTPATIPSPENAPGATGSCAVPSGSLARLEASWVLIGLVLFGLVATRTPKKLRLGKCVRDG